MRLLLESDWFTFPPTRVTASVQWGKQYGRRSDIMLTWADPLACGGLEGIAAPIWILNGKMGGDELQTSDEGEDD